MSLPIRWDELAVHSHPRHIHHRNSLTSRQALDVIGGPSSQRRLCHWLEQGSGRPSVVSVGQRPLFEAVASKMFMESLHYRLNAVYIDLTGLARRREWVT